MESTKQDIDSMMSYSLKFSEADCYVCGFALDGEGGGTAPAETEPGDKPLWLHIDYSEKDSEEWLRKLGIADSIVESLVRLDTRPRTMVLEQGVLVILRTVNANPGQRPDDMVSLRIWIEKNRIITVRQRRVYSVQDIKQELESGRGPRDIQSFVSRLIEKVADRISDYVETIEEEVVAFEQNIESGDPVEARGRISALRREVAGVRRYLAPQRDALDTFSRQAKSVLDAEHAYLIHEQSDRIVRYVEDLDLVRERTLVLQEELMNRMAQEQNSRMYVLSMVAAVFLPISFVTGLFGMNVAGLPGLENPGAFLLVSGAMVVLVLGILALFRARGWL